ncbi:MAG: hypothetical protein PHV06_07155 [bacterium]|nr:hypothetical protein [bacterium]
MNENEPIEKIVRIFYLSSSQVEKDLLLRELYDRLTINWFRRIIQIKSGNYSCRISDELLREIKNDFFMKFSSIKGYDPNHVSGASFNTWSFKVVYNLYLNKITKKGEFSLDPEIFDFILSYKELAIVRNYLNKSEKFGEVLHFFELVRLGLNYIVGREKRYVFTAHVILDLRLKTISIILGKNLNSVKSNYRDARMQFASYFTGKKLPAIDFHFSNEQLKRYLKLNFDSITDTERKKILIKFLQMTGNEFKEFFNSDNSNWKEKYEQIKKGLMEMFLNSDISSRLKDRKRKYHILIEKQRIMEYILRIFKIG